jgi:hypothetical protein
MPGNQLIYSILSSSLATDWGSAMRREHEVLPALHVEIKVTSMVGRPHLPQAGMMIGGFRSIVGRLVGRLNITYRRSSVTEELKMIM